MINNLATILNIDKNKPQTKKFVDESYFAKWAKTAIYSVAGIKSGDTYVMTGTGNGKLLSLDELYKRVRLLLLC